MTNRSDITFDSDRAMDMLGVPGRLTHRTRKPGEREGCWTRQVWISASRPYPSYGPRAFIRAEVRFDDDCGNGHNSFAVTGEVRIPGRRDVETCGAIHGDIAKAFPELAGLLRFHLFDTAGPMHYVANTVYLAGNRDHYGLRLGESRQIINGRTKEPAWSLAAINADGEEVPLHSIPRHPDGAVKPDCPFTLEYRPMLRVGEGKARELDKARNAACWPDATDAELSVEPDALKAALAARLPALMAEFRAAIEAAGFLWSPSDYRA